MKKLLLTLVAGFIFANAPLLDAEAGEYKFDPNHTEIRLTWNHAGLSDQSGEWKLSDGSVDFDPKNVSATKVSVTIDAKSVNTGVEELDGHLQGENFFNAEKFPTITFKSTKAVQTSSNTIAITGDLTIKGNTKPITLDFSLNHNGKHPLGKYFDHYKGQWVGVHGTGSLLRSDYGVGKYAPLTSDLVKINISAELREGGWE